MSDDEQPTEYGLVMPFVTVVSKGGPHDDGAYVAGWEMGHLDALLAHSAPRVHEQTIHAENTAQADLIAMRHGYRCEVEDSGTEGWSYLRLIRAEQA